MGTGVSLRRLLCLGQDKKGGGGKTLYTGSYKGVPAVQPGSVAGGGCYSVMEFEMD